MRPSCATRGKEFKLCHDYKNPLRFKVFGKVCFCCLNNFQTRAKLFRHVAYTSVRCGRYWDMFDDLPVDVFNKLEHGSCQLRKKLVSKGHVVFF